MDIKEYMYVATIVEAGGMSAAAKKLHMSQPALSIFISSLEDRLGEKIFARQKNKLFLTGFGERYVEYARQIIALDSSLSRELEEWKNLTRGEVVLGITETRGMNLLQYQLPEFRRRYPDIKIRLIEGHSDSLERMLQERIIDIAVLSQTEPSAQFESTLLAREDLLLALPESNEACGKAVTLENGKAWMDIRNLRDESFILLHKEQRVRKLTDSLFEKAGYEPRILWEMASAETALRLVMSGMGACFLTSTYEFINSLPSIRAYCVGEPPVSCNIVAAYLSEASLSKAARAMLDVIIDTYPKRPMYHA